MERGEGGTISGWLFGGKYVCITQQADGNTGETDGRCKCACVCSVCGTGARGLTRTLRAPDTLQKDVWARCLAYIAGLR